MSKFRLFIVCVFCFAFVILFITGGKVKIYIEQTLLVNFFQNALILHMTSFFIKEKARFWFLTSSLGAVVALILPFFNLNGFFKILIQIPLATILICISFSSKPINKFLFSFFTFFIFTLLLGGGCFALEQAIGDYPLFVVCLVSLSLFFVVKFVIFYHNRLQRIKSFTYKVVIKANGKEIEEIGYLDSGNVLLDKITNSPIVLINYDVFKQIYQNISLISILGKKYNESINCAHYIKINSVGGANNILAFVADELVINGEQSFKNPTLALSFSGFEKSFKANVLLNSQMIFGG